jgi:hypothetical protein
MSTLDLYFLSPGIFSRLLLYEAQEDLAHGSDYIFIFTIIDYSSQATKAHKRRNWKKSNFKIINKYIRKNLVNSDVVYNKDTIDAQIKHIEDIL